MTRSANRGSGDSHAFSSFANRLGHHLVRRYQTLALCAAAGLTLALAFNRHWITIGASAFFLYIYLGLLVTLVRPRYRLPAVVFTVLLIVALSWINDQKIALTQLPLTFLDLQIAIRDPQGFFNAIGAPWWLLHLLAAICLGVAALAAVAIGRGLGRRRSRSTSSSFRGYGPLASHVFALVAVLALFTFYIRLFVASVYDDVIAADAVWEPRGVADLSHRLGILGFLVYSFNLERIETGDYFGRTTTEPAPSDDDIADAAGSYANLRRVDREELPNIMVVLAESTFDVNKAFHLTVPVRSELFEENEYTQAVGPLSVNAVGGGSWISEFEAIVGLDTRLFGYAGFYSHSSLSPFVKRTFAHYLKRLGYTTYAYYPIEGTFYNAAKAYAKYGFETFSDGPALNLRPYWNATDDEIAVAVTSTSGGEAGNKPFLKYVTLVENHAPHACRRFSTDSQFLTTFDSAASFDDNCVLNEYLSRAESTSRAVRTLMVYLEDVQRRTRRPFVLLVYGDHQPHTFTVAENASTSGFDRYRKNPDKRTTFFHLMSSVPGVLRCCLERPAPHLTLMPTILSAYVAGTAKDLYLGVNFYQYQKCGSDLMRSLPLGFYAAVGPAAEDRSDRCAVYDSLLTAFRRSGAF